MPDWEKELAELFGHLVPCNCHPAFKDRGLFDPSCPCEERDDLLAATIEFIKGRCPAL